MYFFRIGFILRSSVLLRLVLSEQLDSSQCRKEPCVQRSSSSAQASDVQDEIALLEVSREIYRSKVAKQEPLQKGVSPEEIYGDVHRTEESAQRAAIQFTPEPTAPPIVEDGGGIDGEVAEASPETAETLWLLIYPTILVVFLTSMYTFFPQYSWFFAAVSEDEKDDKDGTTAFEASHAMAGDLLSPLPGAVASLSFTGALVQLCGIFQGVGLVNVPVVLALCGWPGLLIVGFVILVKGFIGGLVIECLQAPLTKRFHVTRDFAEIGQTSVGFTVVQIIRTINVLQLLSFASYFMVLIEVSTGPFFVDFGWPMPLASEHMRILCVVVVGLLVFPFTFVSETNLAGLAFLANLAFMVCPAMLIISGLNLKTKADSADFIARSEILDWATGFSIIFGADAGIQSIPHVYEVCQDKNRFFHAFAMAVVITGSVIFFTAYIGYYFYGNHLQACFTLNIGYDLEGNFMTDLATASKAINVALVLKVLLVFPLILVQISDSLNVLSEYMNIRSYWSTFLHRFLTLGCVVGMSIAFGTQFISKLATFGCTLTMLTNVCAPVLYYLVMFRSQGMTPKAVTAALAGLLALAFGFGILAMETGNQVAKAIDAASSNSSLVLVPGHGMTPFSYDTVQADEVLLPLHG
jgi:hypothetical protein